MSEKKYKVGYFDDPVDIDDYVETIDGEYLNACDVVRLLNKLSEENKELKKELESFEQVNFTDLCDKSRTVLYMKKENGDSE